MRNFSLYFEDDGLSEARRIEFTGFDANEAFAILLREKEGRTALLYEGERQLGRIRRIGDGSWAVG